MQQELKIVIDTSIFINPDAHCFFGNTPQEALSNFLGALENRKRISCYIPPSVYEELMKFIENDLPARTAPLINKKPPSSYESSIPALLFYEFIEEIRLRINKGLRIAEKYTRKGLKANFETDKPKSEEELIKSLREEHRAGLREGIIDSKEDFDLILLAKELNAYLATSDNGLVKWAQKLGITCINAKELKEILHRD